MLDIFKLRAALITHYSFKEPHYDVTNKRNEIIKLVNTYAKDNRKHEIFFTEIVKYVLDYYETKEENVSQNYIYKVIQSNWETSKINGRNAIDWRKRKNKVIGYIK